MVTNLLTFCCYIQKCFAKHNVILSASVLIAPGYLKASPRSILHFTRTCLAR